MSGEIDGITYTIVDYDTLQELMYVYHFNGETHPNTLVTTFITSFADVPNQGPFLDLNIILISVLGM